MKTKCIFFDRDGIANVSPGPGYVERLQDFHIIPAFIECAKIAAASGFEVVIVTNQRGVARGIMSAESLAEIHAELEAVMKSAGIEMLGIYCCPHERDSCSCRKPQPGMLLQAAAEHNIDLSESWMIGDSETDIQAGHRAGCRAILVGRAGEVSEADCRVADMRELAEKLTGFISQVRG